MTFWTLIRRSLRFHWRAHLGVVLGAAVGSAALIGALVVGDSVRGSLRERALERIGRIWAALAPPDRTMSGQLGGKIQATFSSLTIHSTAHLKGGNTYPALALDCIASTSDGSERANHVQLIGVNPGLPSASGVGWWQRLWRQLFPIGGLVVNQALAAKLKVQKGDEVLLRVPKVITASREASLSPRADATFVLRLPIRDIAPASSLGNFSLTAQPSPPLNAFVALPLLQQAGGLTGRVNMLLLETMEGDARSRPNRLPWAKKFRWGLRLGREFVDNTSLADHSLRFALRLDDADAQLATSIVAPAIELRSKRVFLDPPITRSALKAETNGQPIVTYLANLLHAGANMTPYSMVTAAGPPWTPANMRDDEILVSEWLTEDLRVKPGDDIALSYFDPESGARLFEHTNTFRVRAIVPMEMPWADRTLMPDFPGIEKAESTSDWDAGFPLVHKIRQKDEDYWKKYRGTPKAFITLAAGQKMWANRFGNLTAIRFPIPTNAASTLTPALSLRERENPPPTSRKTETAEHANAPEQSENRRPLSPLPAGEGQGEGERLDQFETPRVISYKEALERKILANLKPEELGLRFEPVREQALKAAEESQDFGGLFLGFSFFVIAAALLLMALLFSLGLEQRAPEIGTLLALGFTPKQVRKQLLCEGVALSLAGGVLGALGGLAYAKAMLHGLTTIWRDAVGASALSFHFTAQSLVIGLFASVVVCAVTIWLTLRKLVKRPARELLVGEIQEAESRVQSLKAKVIAVGALLMALGLVGWSVAKGDTSNAGVFFGAGALVLVAGLAAANARLMRLAGSDGSTLTPALPMNLKIAQSIINNLRILRFQGFKARILRGILSLRERENPTQHSSETETAGHSNALDQSENGRPLSPLPAGEGQGEGEHGKSLSLSALSLRGCARRRKRSLATVAMLACGSFLIVSIGVFRLDANRDAWKRSSGTGGFALIGETTIPVVHHLNSKSGRDFFALNEKDLIGVSVVPFRVREGDEASCLNLNRAQKPRLLGVKPEMLEGRFTFAKGNVWQNLRSSRREEAHSFQSAVGNRQSAISQSLLTSAATNEAAAIGDANSIQWAMHKKVGGTIDYVDERGQPFKVRIVGAVANSILQGSLIIDEAEFVKRFPSESGYRMFLIDAPSNAVSQVSATLSRAMQDVGLELTPAAERLAQFNAVQNTYLGTFQMLGGLGLLLGSVGLGIVVLRNVLERRGELAVLLAVGFRKSTLQRLLLIENGALLAAGLALGVVAAAVAVLPALLSPSAQLPFASLALTLGAVLINGALWTWSATRLAVRGDLLKALRNE